MRWRKRREREDSWDGKVAAMTYRSDRCIRYSPCELADLLLHSAQTFAGSSVWQGGLALFGSEGLVSWKIAEDLRHASLMQSGCRRSCFCNGEVMLLLFVSVIGLKFFQVNSNQAKDQEIHALCQQLSSKTSGQVEYRTAWTGFCKPKHARICRLVAFIPRGAVVIPGQQIQVQVPPGAGPGQQLQVQTPMGVQFATIPAGVGPGQTFAFIPGAPAPVQAQAGRG
eukprot:Skav220858  [mRNA]  locus=scaffold193:18159:23078:+ [translate_table: standard]